MRFRQRFSSVLLFLYLLTGFVIAFYVFDISNAFSDAATNHALVHIDPPSNANVADHLSPSLEYDRSSSSLSSSSKRFFLAIATHLTDVPFSVWMCLTLIFYLQGFCLLLALTKPNPKQFLTTPLILLFNRNQRKRKREAGVFVQEGVDIL